MKAPYPGFPRKAHLYSAPNHLYFHIYRKIIRRGENSLPGSDIFMVSMVPSHILYSKVGVAFSHT
jgi:hypothetical protein